jgi:hypothetical protein
VITIISAYNHTTSLEFGNTGEPVDVVRIEGPFSGITVLDTTTCASFKSAKANGEYLQLSPLIEI